MEFSVKHFSELTPYELYDILKLRVNVFIVEQNCPYPEIDDKDQNSYHLFLQDENGICAYLRLFYLEAYKNPYLDTAPTVSDTAVIGRVVSAVRHRGYATRLLKEAIEMAKEKFSPRSIVLEAQVYARTLYEGVGFRQVSEEFLEDGIPHIQMMLKL